MRAIVSDWDGSLIKTKDGGSIMKPIGMAALKAACNPFSSMRKHPQVRVHKLILLKLKLEKLWKDKDTDKVVITEKLFDIFNEHVIKGLPSSFVLNAIRESARSSETKKKLDRRMFNVLSEVKPNLERMGILSVNSEYGIGEILRFAGLTNLFDFVCGSQLVEDRGTAIGFSLVTFKKKPQILLRLIRKGILPITDCAYIGDSPDDEGCFELVQHPIIPFLASEEFKQRCAKKYRAFVPENEQDLRNYILKN